MVSSMTLTLSLLFSCRVTFMLFIVWVSLINCNPAGCVGFAVDSWSALGVNLSHLSRERGFLKQ